MHITRWGAAACVAVGVAFAGCGTDKELEARQDQGREMQEAFKPVQARLLKLATDLREAPKPAEEPKAYASFAERMEQEQKTVAALEAPESEVPERERLATALGAAAATLGDLGEGVSGQEADAKVAELQERMGAVAKRRGELEGALRHLTGQGS